MPEVILISQTGRKKLEQELERLEKEAEEVRARVKEAREMGDLSENAEYTYGRQNLGFIEGRMAETRGKLNYSKPIDCTTVPTDKAAFGTVVKLKNLDNGKIVTYQLLGMYDSDVTDESISVQSPIGQEIVDRKVGDKFTALVPRGELSFELLEIQKSQIK